MGLFPWKVKYFYLYTISMKGDDCMKTIKDALDKYPDEMYVDSGKANMVCKIISIIYKKEQAKEKYYSMLKSMFDLEGSK
jgi:hypothetical protein